MKINTIPPHTPNPANCKIKHRSLEMSILGLNMLENYMTTAFVFMVAIEQNKEVFIMFLVFQSLLCEE